MEMKLKWLCECINEEQVQRYLHKKAMKEKLIYLAVCPERDRILLEENSSEMDFENYERILYLVDSMDLFHYSYYLIERYPKLSKALRRKIQKQFKDDKYDLKAELKIVNRWVDEFCENLPTGAVKKYIGECLLGA